MYSMATKLMKNWHFFVEKAFSTNLNFSVLKKIFSKNTVKTKIMKKEFKAKNLFLAQNVN